MTPPRLKTLRKGIAHGRNSYSEEEKNAYSKDTPVFAYMRRSTNKKEQEDSLDKQEDCIDLIIKEHAIDDKSVISFVETRSGFENRKRPQFDAMIRTIDKLKTPCILLAYDSSRLSRNQKDSREIVDRIFGDNGAKKNIREIIFHENRSWNTQSNKDEVYQTLLDNYKESVHTGKRSRDGSLKLLRNGIYTWSPPKGLEHVKDGKTILYMRQNEKMPIIRKAFEMKMAGITHKKIAKYLRENGIKTGERDLNDRYFSNTIYIGIYWYTDKTTGETKDYPVKFFEGKPPISMTLWQAVQENKGKKKDNYGEKQDYFALGEVLRTEGGRRLSGYFQKGTAQYKNTTEGIHISENWIMKEFASFLKKSILKLIVQKRLPTGNEFGMKIVENIIDNNLIEFGGVEMKRDFKLPAITPELAKALKKLEEKTAKKYKDDIKNREEKSFFYNHSERSYNHLVFLSQDFQEYKKVFPNGTKKEWESLIGFLKDGEITIDTIIKLHEGTQEFILECMDDFETILEGLSLGSKLEHSEALRASEAQKRTKINELERKKQNADEELKNIKRNFLKIAHIDGMDTTFKEEETALKQKKKALQDEIDDIVNEKDFDELIARIPQVLKETFELCGKTFTDEENKELKEDIYDLIKLTTFELKIKKKKALEIELYGPVKQVLFRGNAVLEAPPGVEPGYEALQAPV